MSTVGNTRTRALLWAMFGLILLVVIIDGGSCAIARVQIDEDAKTSARFAAQQIAGEKVSPTTAMAAYNAAVSALPNDAETIITNAPGESEDFRLNEDLSITMTVTREAPTLVFQHLPFFKDFTLAKVTHTQTQLGM